jgi:hypothetical protein
MENFNEQEYIKDPNQLDLFAGILLTPEQDKIVEEFIKNQSHGHIFSLKKRGRSP